MDMIFAKHPPPRWVGSDDQGIDLGYVADVRIDCCSLKRDVGQRNLWVSSPLCNRPGDGQAGHELCYGLLLRIYNLDRLLSIRYVYQIL